MGYEWVISGLSVGYQLVISWLSVGYQWVFSGLSEGEHVRGSGGDRKNDFWAKSSIEKLFVLVHVIRKTSS